MKDNTLFGMMDVIIGYRDTGYLKTGAVYGGGMPDVWLRDSV